MKSIHFLLLSCFISAGLNSFSQEIQNNGFENWSNQYYFENPDQFTTTNYLSYFATGGSNVTKTSDAQSGSWAVQLESIASPEGPLFGAVFIGDPDLQALSGGIPFTVRPNAVSGYAKYNIQPNDTAYIAVVFKKFGAPIGYCIHTFYGSQTSYQSFSEPVQWLIPIISPDTMLTGMISSTFNGIPVPGSTITFDNLSFDGVSAPFPNGDFENWTDFESEEPDNWTSSNIFSISSGNLSVTKTDDSYEGNFAVRIENQPVITGDTLGFITNGIIGENGPSGGMPVNDIPDVLSGYYKYIPVGQDTAVAGLTLFKYNPSTGQSNKINEVFVPLMPATTYTYFEVQVDYNTLPEPDTVNIAFGAGNFDESGSGAQPGSILFLDALNITFKPNLVSVNENDQTDEPRAYPNPVSNTLFLDIRDLINSDVMIQITDIHGKMISRWKTEKNSSMEKFNVSELAPGLYFYTIDVSGEKHFTGKFMVK